MGRRNKRAGMSAYGQVGSPIGGQWAAPEPLDTTGLTQQLYLRHSYTEQFNVKALGKAANITKSK